MNSKELECLRETLIDVQSLKRIKKPSIRNLLIRLELRCVPHPSRVTHPTRSNLYFKQTFVGTWATTKTLSFKNVKQSPDQLQKIIITSPEQDLQKRKRKIEKNLVFTIHHILYAFNHSCTNIP